MVSLPLTADGPALPMEPLIDAASRGAPGRVPGLDFRHASCRLSGLEPSALLSRYLELMDDVGMRAIPGAGGLRQSGPYNLLLTRRWMFLVPRRCEHWRGVSVNGLGYAGSLFVRTAAQLDAVRATGPLQVLREVSLPGHRTEP
jgi:ATP adenylyltransferase